MKLRNTSFDFRLKLAELTSSIVGGKRLFKTIFFSWVSTLAVGLILIWVW